MGEGKRRGAGRAAGEPIAGVVDLAQDDFAKLAGWCVFQSEVRILFQDVESLAEIGDKF